MDAAAHPSYVKYITSYKLVCNLTPTGVIFFIFRIIKILFFSENRYFLHRLLRFPRRSFHRFNSNHEIVAQRGQAKTPDPTQHPRSPLFPKN